MRNISREYEKEATIVLYECAKLPKDLNEMIEILNNIAELANVRIVSYCGYQHSNGAKSLAAIVEESNINLSEWLEYNTFIVRIASCNPNSNFEKVKSYLEKRLECKESKIDEKKVQLYLNK